MKIVLVEKNKRRLEEITKTGARATDYASVSNLKVGVCKIDITDQMKQVIQAFGPMKHALGSPAKASKEDRIKLWEIFSSVFPNVSVEFEWLVKNFFPLLFKVMSFVGNVAGIPAVLCYWVELFARLCAKLFAMSVAAVRRRIGSTFAGGDDESSDDPGDVDASGEQQPDSGDPTDAELEEEDSVGIFDRVGEVISGEKTAREAAQEYVVDIARDAAEEAIEKEVGLPPGSLKTIVPKPKNEAIVRALKNLMENKKGKSVVEDKIKVHRASIVLFPEFFEEISLNKKINLEKLQNDLDDIYETLKSIANMTGETAGDIYQQGMQSVGIDPDPVMLDMLKLVNSAVTKGEIKLNFIAAIRVNLNLAIASLFSSLSNLKEFPKEELEEIQELFNENLKKINQV